MNVCFMYHPFHIVGVRVCVYACVRVDVRACVRARLGACLRVYVYIITHVDIMSSYGVVRWSNNSQATSTPDCLKT